MSLPTSRTCCLIHTGRKSGKLFKVTIWFVEIDGDLWVGSLDETRGWVRNLRAAGCCQLNFGSGAATWRCEEAADAPALERFHSAVQAKYPIASRLLRLFVRGGRPVAFRLTAVREDLE
jgi:hypothetical protein